MGENSRGKIWFMIGIGLIVLGGVLYGLAILAGLGFALGQAPETAGTPLLAILIIPGLIALGFVILLLKVIIDRLSNDEDDHYSKTVDK